jgi:hypothetical protein
MIESIVGLCQWRIEMGVHIRLYKNKIYLKNFKTNNEYTITADFPFSHNGLLVADIDKSIEYIKIGIKYVMLKIYLLKPRIYLQPMKNIDEITQAEQHAIIEAVYMAGAREIIIIKDEYEIGTKKIKNEF